MEQILQEIGLGYAIEKFKENKVDYNIVLAASDDDLIKLGVRTIGDRIRLRELCRRRHIHGSSTSYEGAPVTITPHRQGREERALLFTPRNSVGRNNKRKAKASSESSSKKMQIWTGQFLCLADKYATKVPSSAEKQVLQKAGLGFKRIKLDLNGGENECYNKLCSNEIVDNDIVGFPKLKNCGGFELLRCVPN